MSCQPIQTVLNGAEWNYSETVPAKQSPVVLTLNHPKNYLGVLLATACDGDLVAQIRRWLVDLPDRAIAGAVALGLVSVSDSQRSSSDTDSSHTHLPYSVSATPLGTQILHRLTDSSSPQQELRRFGDLRGSSQRFVTAVPEFWRPLLTHLLTSYHLAGDVATLLESTGPVTLAELGQLVARTNHPFGIALFANPSELDYAPPSEVTQTRSSQSPSRGSSPPIPDQPHLQRSRSPSQSSVSVPPSASPAEPPFTSPRTYRGQTIYQLKAILFHCGLLTERGADTSAIIPTQDIWQLDPHHLAAPSSRGDQ